MNRAAGVLAIVLAGVAGAIVYRTVAIGHAPAPPVAAALPVPEPGEAVLRLSEALQIETVSPQAAGERDAAAFRVFHRYLAAAFPRVHQALSREWIGGSSLLYTWPGLDPDLSPVLLMAHQDVVPVEGAQEDWREGPFSGAVSDGAIWGRGALDDKSSLMAILEAVELLLAEDAQPARTLYLFFGHDEETGGQEGAAALARRWRLSGRRLAWVLDEGGVIADGLIVGLKTPAALIGVAEKGFVSLELLARAEGGHASRPPPQTAAGIVAQAVVRLEENPFPGRIEGVSRRMFEALAPGFPLLQRVALANLWLTEPFLRRRLLADPGTAATLRTTQAATLLNAGIKDNVLPREARAVVNFRILPGDSIESVRARVEAVIDDSRVTVRALEFQAQPSAVSRQDVEAFRAIATAARAASPDLNLLVAPLLVIGATDARHFAELADDVYRFLPYRLDRERVAGLHGTGERIPVEEYLRMIRFYRSLIGSGLAP